MDGKWGIIVLLVIIAIIAIIAIPLILFFLPAFASIGTILVFLGLGLGAIVGAIWLALSIVGTVYYAVKKEPEKPKKKNYTMDRIKEAK